RRGRHRGSGPQTRHPALTGTVPPAPPGRIPDPPPVGGLVAPFSPSLRWEVPPRAPKISAQAGGRGAPQRCGFRRGCPHGPLRGRPHLLAACPHGVFRGAGNCATSHGGGARGHRPKGAVAVVSGHRPVMGCSRRSSRPFRAPSAKAAPDRGAWGHLPAVALGENGATSHDEAARRHRREGAVAVVAGPPAGAGGREGARRGCRRAP
ncbi:MAG: hypothetical protein QOF98_1236, partial [Streptomyces sp.]|nr:hypothetical protein [Streptomyces sp.]